MPTSRVGRRSEAGYTLVELLVVLVLAGLAVTAMAQGYVRQSPGLQLRQETMAVAATLREARSLAIRDNAERQVLVDREARSLRIVPQGRERFLTGDLEIAGIAAGQENGEVGAIYFFPDGSSTGGRVALSRGGQTHAVAVNWLTGIVKIHEDVR